MSSGVKRDMTTFRSLKKEGHDIIDDLVKKGWSKKRVYVMLADRLGVAESGAHFYNIYTIRDATKAVNALKKLRVDLLAERKRKHLNRVRAAAKKPEVIVTVHAKKSFWQKLLGAIGL